MKINPEIIRVHKGLRMCTFWVNGYFFLFKILSILQVYSCEGRKVFRICCLCWNSCFSVGKRIQLNSWMTNSFPFSCLHLSILPQNNSPSQWNVLTTRNQTITAHEGWITAQPMFTLENKAQRPCSIPPGSCSVPHYSTQSLWVQWVFSPLVSLCTTLHIFLFHSP